MKTRPLLIFDLDGARFGIDANLVRETIWLPELTPAEEMPPWVVGIFSLRGPFVPVIDLRRRFGHSAQPYTPTDQVVVLDLDGLSLGLLVSAVREVSELDDQEVQSPPRLDCPLLGQAHLVTGEARVGSEIVMLLDVRQVTQQPGGSLEVVTTRGAGYFCPEATPEQRLLFRARAEALQEAATEEEGRRLGLAVLELAGEYFAVELAAVREFCELAPPYLIPCCPPHVLGAIALRGNLLTLLDPGAVLLLPSASRTSGTVVVAHLRGEAVGLAVDGVHDVVYLRPEELRPPPPLLRERHGEEIMGVAPYEGKMMAVLDLPALLAREEWIVNETV